MTTDYASALLAPVPQLDGYRILGVLGQGGMGTVYHAEQEVLGRQVAIKVLNRDLTKKARQLDRFLQEARVVARMGCHAHIVQVHDVVRDAAGSFCIVMEFVAGSSLAASLRSGERPSLADALRVAIQVCHALEIAHARGVVHRDIKPENILLTREGWVKVTDFGIARSDSAQFRTQTGEILGTPHYMAPEQVKGDGTADARADIYSLCVVLYYLSVGVLPFDDTNPYSIAFKHINSPVPPPSRALPSIPPRLEKLILRGLEKDPEDRFQTAAELRATLERTLAEVLADTADDGHGVADPVGPVTTLSGGAATGAGSPFAGGAATPSGGGARHELSTPEFRAVIETDPTTGTRYRFELSQRAVAVAALLLVLLVAGLYHVGRRSASEPAMAAARRERPPVAGAPAPPVAPAVPAPAAATPIAALPADPRPLLAVLPFAVDAPELTETEGRTIAGLLSRQFSADAYRLIDPAQLARTLGEDEAALARHARDSEAAAEAGRRAGVRYVVTGSLSRLGVLVATAALVDTTTGSIIATASIDADEVGKIVGRLDEVAAVLSMTPEERGRYRNEMLMAGVVEGASRIVDQVDVAAMAPAVGAGAYRVLGMATQAGIGLPRDAGWATRFYRMAADEGSTDAVDNLVAVARAGEAGSAAGAHGEVADATPEELARLDELVRNLRNPAALVRFGDRFRDGHGLPRSAARALDCYERAATVGDAAAMLRLADLHRVGAEELAPDPEKAREWLRRAADAGDPVASFRIAETIQGDVAAGREVAPPLRQRMVALYQAAAAAGQPVAMRRLAELAAAPAAPGAESRPADARAWYERAAEAGDVPSMLVLADWLAEGRDGVPADRVMAVVWLRRAASQGDLEAMRRLRALDPAAAQQAD